MLHTTHLMIVMCCYNGVKTLPFKKSTIFKEINDFIMKIIYWILFTVIKSDLNWEKISTFYSLNNTWKNINFYKNIK